MKQEVNEYYQCGKNGYVRYENVDVGQLKATKQVPVVSRCNQILPYKMHKLQVKEPITISSAKNIQSLPPIQQSKKETTMNYSFSTSLMENPNRILERDQVHSIHIDDKTSSRTKAQQRQLDLAKSTFTSLKKTKGDMKRSLFSINQSHFTNDTNSKDTQKIQMIISELIKEKQKREDFQRKYEVLLSLINREQDKKKEIPRRDSSPQTKKNRSKRKYQRSNTSSESQSQDQDQVIIDYGRKKNKTYRSPIIINLSPQMLNPQNQQNQSYEFKKIQQSESMIEIKENLSQIHQRVEMLHENMDFLEKKIDQQEAKRQKQMLLQELKQKERKIEEVMKQNLKMKEINDLLTGQKIIMKAEQQNHRSFFGIKIDKNPLAISFCLALVIILLLLNIRGAIC